MTTITFWIVKLRGDIRIGRLLREHPAAKLDKAHLKEN